MRHLLSIPLIALALCIGIGHAADEKLDLSTPLGGEPAADTSDTGPGDNATFPIKTGSDISTLKEGAQYRNPGEKVLFKVVAVESRSATGGRLTFQRVGGTSNPGKRFALVSGVGPQTIEVTYSLLDLYVEGGPFLHPIAILGVVTIILAINSFLLYQRKRQIPEDFVIRAEKALKKGDIRKFNQAAEHERGLFPALCRAMGDRWSSSTIEDIEKRTETVAAAQINRLRFPVKFLNLISVAAPLLGLLGTIVGMVIVFEGVADATGAAKAQKLAEGIRVKLFSTASALIVAIPALFLYFVYNQRLSNLIATTELLSEQFMHRISVLKRRGVDAQPDAEEADEDDADAESAEEDIAEASDEDDAAPQAKRIGARRA